MIDDTYQQERATSKERFNDTTYKYANGGIILNGAALVAVLGFIGNISGGEEKLFFNSVLPYVLLGGWLFTIGVIFGVLAKYAHVGIAGGELWCASIAEGIEKELEIQGLVPRSAVNSDTREAEVELQCHFYSDYQTAKEQLKKDRTNFMKWLSLPAWFFISGIIIVLLGFTLVSFDILALWQTLSDFVIAFINLFCFL